METGERWEVSIIITKEDFQQYWRGVKERILSSFSGQQFGHYAAVAHSDLLSEVHSRHLVLITTTDAAPNM
jgi:hypothetical protein